MLDCSSIAFLVLYKRWSNKLGLVERSIPWLLYTVDERNKYNKDERESLFRNGRDLITLEFVFGSEIKLPMSSLTETFAVFWGALAWL